ncbi:GINS complex subunit Sld [Parasponia andersonii]|uniref:DNA replication complex GINS protein SLD5 n=1 Tax=Parasponia andersonii TaxID=3476 RepID=A0A2P5CV43_PARAD|nr:GINS complex subunit Sld [Parasponia andersonii]
MVADFVEASRHWCEREYSEYSRGVSDIARIGAALLCGLDVEGDFGTLVIPDIELMILSQGCMRLVKLELSGCDGSYDGIRQLGSTLRLCSRKSINLSPVLDEHFGSGPTIKELHLQECQFVDEQGVKTLLLVCEAVREVVFQDCWGLADDVFSIAAICWRVKLISLKDAPCYPYLTSALHFLQEETVEEFAESGVDPLTVSLYQMDLDRTQFLLRSYLRIRLQKIEKYMFHILNTDELFNRLSKEEKSFAERSSNDLKIHLEESVLSRLPDNYQSILQQSIISEETDMVPKPQLDVFVVCKTKYYLGHIQLEGIDDGNSDNRGNQRPLEEPFEMEPNVLYFVRYKPIKKFVEEGRIDLY